ncbi:TIGR02921 family PEP-CTERM protein [Microcoleus sp. FACHB-68]|uniref:TIGR02921 family PEP-CTERM protein n=1 Tax=Microcoleus sp. FACHB-68 TaxID=2692826 RepID=UPI00168483A6|nr:TIGR02921 family PEP-CTERM protein [Microcoleus sp. FACHB-68]MBD1935895.1 TIGR02921 family PEP-CTERM protein [Microcoleus sp. FACHB-68]
MKNRLDALFQVIFWLWNLTFLLLTYLGILPLIGLALVDATFTGLIPGEFILTLTALIAVPAACTVLGAWRFRKQPVQLMRLFYGVEAPLFALCLLRFFILRELTPASTLILGTVVVCVAAFLLELLYGYAERHPALAWTQLIAHSLMLIVGLYAGLLLLFYAVPAAPAVVFGVFGFLGELWRILTSEPLYFINYAFSSFLLLLLFGISCTLFLAMPSLLASSYIQSGIRILRAFASQNGRTRAFAGSLGVVTAWMILFISFQQQPQLQAFELLDKPAATDSARAELVAKSDTIRAGLLNAYLSSYRYLSTIQESNQIRVMYEDTFNTPQPVSQFLQDSYNRLMAPFLYNGSRKDIEKAEKLYADFFDQPIQKGEQKTVLHALKSTVNRDEAKAGLLNIGQKKVWLQTQEVTVKPHGDWADVELYEVYKNQTADVEEVLYYFSLPESAVITGVWLGDTNDRSKRFPFTVSPRGAAQKVYNQQVNRYRPVDPALLEQVGPRHYRLRAFPVPTPLRSWERDSKIQRPTEMNLWLTYQVMRQEKGWPLPVLGEKRNIFWTKDTERIRNGKTVTDFQDNWLEAYLPAEGEYKPATHQVNLPDGSRITAKPLVEKDYTLPIGKRFAVVLDSSRSMAAHTQQISETFNWLKARGFADNNFANNDADLYVTASTGKQPQRIDDLQKFDTGKMPFYGTLQLKEMLRQFVQLRGDTAYDGILVVTDEGSYELSDDSKEVPFMPAPAWMVHLGAMPPAYDDATLKAIQDSGGGVATNLPEVLERMATKAALGPSAVSVVDGYAWVMEKPASETAKPQPGNKDKVTPDNKAKATSNTGFEPLAARQLVLGLSKTIKGNEISQLDAIHAIAKNFKIVTPYSSMIVLVNDEQRKALKEAEADANRFERQVEDGKEQLGTPNNPLNASVPEPGTVIGLAAGTVMLIVARQRRRFKSRI